MITYLTGHVFLSAQFLCHLYFYNSYNEFISFGNSAAIHTIFWIFILKPQKIHSDHSSSRPHFRCIQKKQKKLLNQNLRASDISIFYVHIQVVFPRKMLKMFALSIFFVAPLNLCVYENFVENFCYIFKCIVCRLL